MGFALRTHIGLLPGVSSGPVSGGLWRPRQEPRRPHSGRKAPVTAEMNTGCIMCGEGMSSSVG